jgi:peptidoglycan/LPS O-acetylase OafA/YrhL
MPAADPTSRTSTDGLSRVPYLPGLDGLRAVAVVAVMLYHASHHWLPGGYLGVEVFFVISGYLITMLLVGEYEVAGSIDLRSFWKRRFRRLLPALYVMLAMLALYLTAFYPVAREQVRGDFLAGIGYISNWYQVFVGQGYAAAESMVPLRHLWSLAVEEQFYLVWPVVVLVLLARARRGTPTIGVRLMGVAVLINVLMGALFVGGYVPLACSAETSNGYWHLFGRCINVNDTLYLSSVTRAGGLMLGAGFAMLWRPNAIMRSRLRYRGRVLDIVAAIALAALIVAFWKLYLFDQGRYNPLLFRGGFFLVGLLTLLVIAAVTHRYAAAGDLLGNPVMKWIGTRSYGLYLYHWPIYEIIRKQAQIELSVVQFVFAMVVTCVITELSYRLIEVPIRQGHIRALRARLLRSGSTVIASVAVVGVVALAAVSLVNASPHCVGAVACSLAANTTDTTSTTSAPGPAGSSTSSSTTTTTTIQLVPDKYVAIGDSVMVGARHQLAKAGFVVNAKENRGGEGVKNTVIKMRDINSIGDGTTVVIQVGTNGPLNDEAFAAILDAVPANAKGVVMLTAHAPNWWVKGNNATMRALPAKYPKLQILDWDAAAAMVKLCPDHTHLTCDRTAPYDYANLILTQVGLPTLTAPK